MEQTGQKWQYSNIFAADTLPGGPRQLGYLLTRGATESPQATVTTVAYGAEEVVTVDLHRLTTTLLCPVATVAYGSYRKLR
ncbi:hypothetical protein HanIR_Chr14g0695791 [Helianthus annuus]|nr:hypothetical protein HanIR_Chr14g0695791 [Helianthus annuus]